MSSSFEDIKANHTKYKFCAVKCGEFKFILLKEKNYINVTKLCQLGDREYRKWSRLDGSKDLINMFSQMNKIPVNELFIEIRGGYNQLITGTYSHPDLVPHIASWISTKFAIIISGIIKEWTNLNPYNEYKYWSDLGDAVINHPNPEKESVEMTVRDKIAKEENGKTEVQVPAGLIDVLTNTKIIEVKVVSNWKHAVGQVLVYSLNTPNHEKWIYLFDSKEYAQKDIIVKYCTELDVNVKFLD